jgi:hypothetical protein
MRVSFVPLILTSGVLHCQYGGHLAYLSKYAHWIFILLNLVNNIFGCGSMILAGAQLVTGMTGMHVVAACILIPAGGK